MTGKTSPPHSSPSAKPSDELLADYLVALEAGVAPPPAEFLARYPELAPDLELCLPSLVFIHRAADPAALVGPAGAAADDSDAGMLGDYRILREVGRGGMGVVYEAQQVSLGRRVALKVLPFAATMDPRQLLRFHNEARAAASLEHPHIVPVYGVGSDRGVHYYAMKFIDGRSLADPLAGRGGPAATAPPREATVVHAPPGSSAALPVALVTTRSVPTDAASIRRVAEWGVQAAEALDYAHSMGVVHRDVKPHNLMIDVQGHLWVADFGVARTATDSGLTLTGDVLGTLRYMSPEQALAGPGVVDQRTDVYSLGVTLYELLTGRPAVAGDDKREVLRRIAEEEPPGPRSLNRAVPVDLETVILKATAREAADRYPTAQALAADLQRFLEERPVEARRASLLLRLRKWARRHRPVVWSAAAVLLATAGVVGGAIGWLARDRATREAETERVVGRALDQAADWQKKGKVLEALAAARQAEGLLAGRVGTSEWARRVRARLTDLELTARLDEVRLAMTALLRDRWDFPAADREYEQLFREYGMSILTATAPEAAEQIGGRTTAVELAAALDSWAGVRRTWHGEEDPGWRHLSAVASLADPDEWRNQFREAWRKGAEADLTKLMGTVPTRTLPPSTLALLGKELVSRACAEQAVPLLRQAQRRHPDDFWLNHELARALEHLPTPRWDESVRFSTAAVAIRPASPGAWVGLGFALTQQGKLDDAQEAYREAIRLEPDYSHAHTNLGVVLTGQGQPDEGLASHREALRVRPGLAAAHNNLGHALLVKGELDGALDSLRTAIRLKPDLAIAHYNLGCALAEKGEIDAAISALRQAIVHERDHAPAHYQLGNALQEKGDLDAAVVSYRQAIRLRPDHAAAHLRLGSALCKKGRPDAAVASIREAIRLRPTFAEAHIALGDALMHHKGEVDAAVSSFREGIRLRPAVPEAHFQLANLLLKKGELDAGLASLREAIRLRPAFPEAYNNVGWALRAKRDLDGAADACRKAIELRPTYVAAHHNLGNCLDAKGDLDGAAAAYRETIRLKPDHVVAYFNLGDVLLRKGDLDGAVEANRRATQLDPHYPLAFNGLGRALEARGDLNGALAAHREAIRIAPGYPDSHCELGHFLQRRGEFEAALAMLRRGHKLGSPDPNWEHPSEQWVRECERLVEVERQVQAMLRGQAVPDSPGLQAEMASLCLTRKRRPATAADLFRTAFGGDPKLAEKDDHRYHAACAAALAGCGKGEDAAPEAERARWRRQAHEWLRAELATREKKLPTLPANHSAGLKALEGWRRDTRLAGVRDPEALAAIPEAERSDWKRLWSDVDALLARAQAADTPPKAKP